MESSKQIEERAGLWILKRDSGAWSEEDQVQLTAWMEAATANRVAFLRLAAAWEEMNRLKALGAGFPRLTVPTPGQLLETVLVPESSEFSRAADQVADSVVAITPQTPTSLWRPLAVAASLLIVALAIHLLGAGPFFGDRYSTPVGGVATVPLRDGSNITLNTASKVRVQLTEKERFIDLAQGEAFFEVAKDVTRPFVVQAGDKRVIAVGTKFSVRRDGDDVRVVVTEGIVRFEDARAATEVVSANAAGTVESTRLTAGAVARATGSNTIVRTASLPEAEELLSWRSGYVIFRETALADAVAEFNRYTARRIVIRDPQIAAMRLTGKFRSNNYEAFVRLLEQSFPIRSEQTSEEVVLSAR